MAIIVTVPDGFEYLGAAFVSTVVLLFGQNALVGRYRKRAGIAYPQLYAEKAQEDASADAKVFNCAQRAHQNTLENIPIVYVTTLLTGLKYPVFAASALGFWTLSRVSYTRGYITGEPKNRATPLYIAGLAATIGLLGTSAYISGKALYNGVATSLFGADL